MKGLILLFGGVVLMVAIIAFIWGRIDPKVKAQNTKYEKSLKDNARDKSHSPTKKDMRSNHTNHTFLSKSHYVNSSAQMCYSFKR